MSCLPPDTASHAFGAGPGAVRFIDGTFSAHAQLEARIARFVGRPAARIFNSAYTTVLGLAITLAGPETFWIGDALNHNCIIRAMRIANVPSAQRAIYKHNDLADLAAHLERVPDGTGRVAVIFDGIFSMRGDNAPVDAIAALVAGTSIASVMASSRSWTTRTASQPMERPGGAPKSIVVRASTSSSGRSARRSA